MQVRDLTKPVNSKTLNENMSKKFGYKINLESFTREQLEDARNKLRTSLSQFETNESYDSVLESHTYQKTRMMLDVLNQAIAEREASGEIVESSKTKMKKDPKKLAAQAKAMESVSNEWRRVAVHRLRSGQDSAQDLVNELVIQYTLDEDSAKYVLARLLAETTGNQRALRVLTEGEEERAELIMASKDMVDRLTSWLEDTASMQAENLLELLDSIRDEMGSDVSEQFAGIVKPALQELYQTLERNREALAGAVAILTGGEAPTMGASAAPEMPEMPEPEAPVSAPPAAGGEEPAGRATRESVERSRRIGMILSSKKK